jgi:transposase
MHPPIPARAPAAMEAVPTAIRPKSDARVEPRAENLTTSDPVRLWDPKLEGIHTDLAKSIPRIFDRNSEQLEPVPVEWLRTVADVLRNYHRQPEYKFLGGGWNEDGVLRLRHVFVDRIEDIGKESDGWEEDEAPVDEQESVLTYPSSLFDRERIVELIKSVGKHELAREAKIAMRGRLVYLPPYTPELQPAQTLWALVDEPIVNKHIATIEDPEEKIATRCVALAEQREQIRSRTGFHWWPKRIVPN